ncbi:MAG: AI-2E family transporter [Myxococcota bacterium]
MPVRDLTALSLLALVAWAAYALRAVTIPVVIAFAAAYAFDPCVRWTRDRWSWPRWLSSTLALTGVSSLALGLAVAFGPALIADTEQFVSGLRLRLANVDAWVETTLPAAWAESLGSSRDWVRPSQLFHGALDALSAATTFVALAGFFITSVVFTMMLFVFFSVRMPALDQVMRWVPKSQRATALFLVRRFRDTFGGYIRGQAVVAVFTTVGFALGFSLAGVPSALTVAAIGGFFSFIPNGQVAGPLLAILLGLTGGEGDVSSAVAYPLIVYFFTQSLETFVVTPLVQSSHTRLPVAWVLGSLLAGATVGGVVGVFLAIPVAAFLRIVAREIVGPRLTRYAERT